MVARESRIENGDYYMITRFVPVFSLDTPSSFSIFDFEVGPGVVLSESVSGVTGECNKPHGDI